MTTNTHNIYIADLHAYTCGDLRGFWLNPKGKNAEEISAEIHEFVEAVPGHEEWAVHDYENFPNLGEYPNLENIEAVSSMIEDYGYEIVDAYINYFGVDSLDGLPERYQGTYASSEAYIENLIGDCYSDVIDALPDFIRSRIDYEGIAHDFDCSGEYVFSEISEGIAVFLNY